MASTSEQEQAVALKNEGNTLYKARQFDEAAQKYQAAYELHKDITFLNNLAAVYFEQGDYDKCIATCERAVEEGRDMRADYKLIAKAFGRMGSASLRQDNYDAAIKAFQRSLTEHRTPDVLAKLKDAETTKAENERLAYIDPAKADEARELGNKAFKSGDFAGSVAHYAESIKRNPADARGYTNRSAALTKLLALPEALKDAEKAIEVQPEFVKGYIRKSHVMFAMKEYSKALAAIQEAAEHDTEGKHTTEISQQMRKVANADSSSRQGETDEQAYARAMRDPQVAQIMADPVMISILQQAQNEPASMMQHMQNPDIRKKVEVLIRAGIIKTGRP